STYAQDLMKSLELQLMKANIQLEIVGYYQLTGNRAKRISFAQIEKKHNVLGYVVYAQRLSTEQSTRLLELVERTRKPVSILDVGTIRTDPVVIRSNPRSRSFYYWGGERGGELVGQYLAGLGHSRIAYFSVVNDQHPGNATLSRKRGLDTAFAATGHVNAVRHMYCERFSTYAEVAAHFERKPPFRDLVTLLARFDEKVKQVEVTPHTHYPPMPTNHPLHRFYWYELLRPCFEAALEDPSITAWVGFSDTIAFLAYSFLKSRGVRVPQDISLMGFDDTVEAFGFNLSSYNFNCEGMITAVLDHIIRFSSSSLRGGGNKAAPYYEVPGRVMARGTTGAARERRA
ncbi:MAG: hypothetical protein GF331_19260, partial [Chitinivibrionales bacterium]|nr:hypothetical protein [Chitinivibrionales bacterium]